MFKWSLKIEIEKVCTSRKLKLHYIIVNGPGKVLQFCYFSSIFSHIFESSWPAFFWTDMFQGSLKVKICMHLGRKVACSKISFKIQINANEMSEISFYVVELTTMLPEKKKKKRFISISSTGCCGQKKWNFKKIKIAGNPFCLLSAIKLISVFFCVADKSFSFSLSMRSSFLAGFFDCILRQLCSSENHQSFRKQKKVAIF